MQGSQGTLAIKLGMKVAVTAISVDHIPKNEALDIRSAPREFRVTGASSHGAARRTLVEGMYSIDDGALYSQTFALPERSSAIQFVQFEVLTNHGHDDYTCLYRFRVHGDVVEEEDQQPH